MSSDYEYSDEDVDYYDDEDEDMLSAQDDGECPNTPLGGLPLLASHTGYHSLTRSSVFRARLRSLR